jgi:hypothetical protein
MKPLLVPSSRGGGLRDQIVRTRRRGGQKWFNACKRQNFMGDRPRSIFNNPQKQRCAKRAP